MSVYITFILLKNLSVVWDSYNCFFLTCQALEEKEKGNAAYKKKDFEVALGHYSAAIELDPTNITFRNNRAGGDFVTDQHSD